jgi:hypothetical protein
VFFRNSQCVVCKTPLGYDPDAALLLPLDAEDGDSGLWHAVGPAAEADAALAARRYRRCANFDNAAGCNWLLPVPAGAQAPEADATGEAEAANADAAGAAASTGDVGAAVMGGGPAAARRTGGHPAKRVFQAVRIEVNGELDALGPAIDAAIDLLVPGGRVVTLAYHSGEDRLVKERFALAATGGCTCPPGLPCVCGAVATVRLLNRGARKPGADEIAVNPRAEAARLRAIEKLDTRGGSS